MTPIEQCRFIAQHLRSPLVIHWPGWLFIYGQGTIGTCGDLSDPPFREPANENDKSEAWM